MVFPQIQQERPTFRSALESAVKEYEQKSGLHLKWKPSIVTPWDKTFDEAIVHETVTSKWIFFKDVLTRVLAGYIQDEQGKVVYIIDPAIKPEIRKYIQLYEQQTGEQVILEQFKIKAGNIGYLTRI